MADVHTPAIRSKNMRAITSSDTKPELLVRKGLHAAGFRYRLGGAGLPGRPDLVLPKHKTVIFVHGCFWHGHDCKYFRIPQTRSEFWLQKINANKARDKSCIERLLELGWNVIVLWECLTRKARADPSVIVIQVKVLLDQRPLSATLSILE